MYSSIRSFTYLDGKISSASSHLILETPLEIIINEEMSTLIMFTPDMTRELVTGFVFTEGFIDKISDIQECTISSIGGEDGEELIEARVTIPSETSMMTATKSICGKDNYYDLKKGLGRVKSKYRFSMEVLGRVPKRLEESQRLYKKTGGAHAAVLLNSAGNLLVCSEDMGRHNAVDKVIGAALMQKLPFQDKIMVTSGRASLEMILKTARAGIPVFVAMSRPTSRAVEAAKFYNITLLDMARDSNRIYSHVRRIEGF
ncbi:MAG: hypothetical protein AMK69_29075 [Nitrospira bacterium SG8_3]|nr:MAG: hypothetical protein AMK69_29075 [Nitrospira bacterium SG8_3]